MRAESIPLLAGILAASAYIPHSTFRYELLKSFRRNTESCRVCYGDDCTTVAQPRCDYYVETEYIMDDEEDGEGEETEVDEMVYDLVEQASQSWTIQECLPLISEYTDCTKDNICISCMTCNCNAAGKWSCKKVQQCRPQPELDVDRQVLVAVIEALENYEKSAIKKRSVKNYSKKSSITSSKELKETTYVKIAGWVYGVPINVEQTSHIAGENIRDLITAQTALPSTQSVMHSISTSAPDYLDFDEVLRNIADDGKQYKRRKSQLKDKNSTVEFDMDLDDIQLKNHSESENFLDMLNAIEEGNDAITESFTGSTFVVDLLANNNGNEIKEVNNDADDIINILNKELKNTIDIDESYYRFGMDPIKLKKREISVMDSNSTTEATTTINTVPQKDLNNTVLIPLTNIIDDKQNELNDLLQIKENLLNYMNINNDTDLNNTTDRVTINGSNTYFSIYKLDLIPEIGSNFRKNNPNNVDMLLFKLKRDIYEVRRDIAAIQNNSNTEDLPDDLKILIRSMKKYNLQKHRNNLYIKEKSVEPTISSFKYSRRKYLSDDTSSDSIKSQFINILHVLEKNMPQANVMVLISHDAKKIIKRVINQHYVDQSSAFGYRLYDGEFNITHYLKSIGKSWLKLTVNIDNSPPSEKIYAMKLLHLALCKDSNKLTDAISLIDFDHSRRMILMDTPENDVMDKINKGLNSIRNKVQVLINYRNKATRINTDVNMPPDHKLKKTSFLKKLRNLLRSSKRDIIEMKNKRVPKSEIVKTIAKKKLDELAQEKVSRYENTMIRWQNDLNVIREKRAAMSFKNMKKQIKDILMPNNWGKKKRLNGKKAKQEKATKYIPTRKLKKDNRVMKKKTTHTKKMVTKKLIKPSI